jgi:LmbE family N-acetylglucosaminyl deacetylase
MRLNFTGERVLAVMAHPDDAELLCAGTLARAQAEGSPVAIAVMCRGEKGAGSGAAAAGKDLGAIRHAEAQSATDLLRAQLYWLGFSDGELFDSRDTRSALIEIFRQFRPTLAISHSPMDYHPDHRAASAIAEAVSWFCASRGHRTASEVMETPPRMWLSDTLEMSGFSPHFFVDVSGHMEMKRRMLECHRSQLQRAGDRDFMPLSDLMTRQSAARGAQCGVAWAEAFRWHRALKRTGAF